MKPEKREQLINRTNTLAVTLRRAANAEATKADAEAARELKKTQDNNFAQLMTTGAPIPSRRRGRSHADHA